MWAGRSDRPDPSHFISQIGPTDRLPLPRSAPLKRLVRLVVHGHHLDGVDVEEAGRGPLPVAGASLHAFPATKGRGDATVRYSCPILLLEEHARRR